MGRLRTFAGGVAVLALVAGVVVAFVATPERATWSGRQLAGNYGVVVYYGLQHVRYTIAALAMGSALALPLSYVAVRWPATYPALLSTTNALYAIPSIAMFVMLGAPLGYLNDRPIVVTMALYTLIILVRNTVESVRSVPAPVVAAADGMGYRRLSRFVVVELPLAVPGIVAGLRLAAVSTVSLISVGALIGRGGLGHLFADGRARHIAVELWAGGVTIVVLALVLDALLLIAGRLATPWRRIGQHEGSRVRPARRRLPFGQLADGSR